MNKQEYSDQLSQLKTVAPDHIIIPTLLVGYSELNAKYLQHALNKLRNDENEAPENRIETNDAYLSQEYRSIWRLTSRRNKHSNKFHLATNNKQRALIVDEISSIQGQLKRHYENIDAYKKTGIEPPKKKTKKLTIPQDKLKISEALKNRRSSISRKKRELKITVQRLMKDPGNEKLKSRKFDIERTLNKWEIHKKQLENALAIATLE